MENTIASTYSKYDPNRLLNVLMERLGIAGDKELSQRLNVSAKVLQKIRTGELTISASMLLWMAECAQTTIEDLRSILGDRRKKLRLSYVI
jgi:transcriptional regulator with XRE-family HTH domain